MQHKKDITKYNLMVSYPSLVGIKYFNPHSYREEAKVSWKSFDTVNDSVHMLHGFARDKLLPIIIDADDYTVKLYKSYHIFVVDQCSTLKDFNIYFESTLSVLFERTFIHQIRNT